MLEYSKQDSDSKIDGNSTPPALVVGKVRSAQEMWPLLQRVLDIVDCSDGALIIFSQKSRGRIGLSADKRIIGAIEEISGAAGLVAVKKLLSVDNGMFGFRQTVAGESKKLDNSLTVDLQELLTYWQNAERSVISPVAAVEMLVADTATDNGQTSDTNSESVAKTDADASKSAAKTKADAEAAFAYLKWFSEQVALHPVDHPEVRPTMPKFSDVLKAAVPTVAAKSSSEVTTPVEQDKTIDDAVITSGQFAKLEIPDDHSIHRDIERSFNKHLVEPVAVPIEQVPVEQAALEQMTGSPPINKQYERTWTPDELNSIPTPKNQDDGGEGGDEQTVSQNFGRRTEGYQEQVKPLLTPKEFVKRTADEEVEEQQAEQANLNHLWATNPQAFAVICLLVIGVILFFINADIARSSRDQCIADGRAALKHGDYHDAALLFSEAINKSASAHAYFYRAVAYARNDEPEKAIADLNKALSMGESESRVRTLRASIEAHMGDYDKAIEDATVVIVDEPQNAEAYQIRASCRSHRNEFESTIKDCTTALAFCKDPEIRARLYLERAFAFGRSGKRSDAESDLDKAVEARPTAAIFMQRGESYRLDKKYKEAIDSYNQSVTIDPRSSDAYLSRGISQFALHHDREALRDFGRALSIDPNNVEALIQRGNVHLSRNEWRMAANDFEGAVALNPGVAEAQHKLHLSYAHLHKAIPGGLTADNLDVVKSETLVLPNTVKELIDLGYKQLYSGTVYDAIACFAAAVKKEPNNAVARKYLAHALMKNNAFAQAAGQFQSLSALQPLDVSDLVSMAQCYNNAGQADTAYKLLVQIVAQHPGSAAAKAELAKSCVARGDLAQATKICREGQQQAKTAGERQLFENILPTTLSPQTAPTQSAPNNPGGGA